MFISKIAPLLLFLCIAQIADAQTIMSRVTFPIDATQTSQVLARAGVDLSHGNQTSRNSFTTDVDSYEIARFNAAGIRYNIDIPDLMIHRQLQKANPRGGQLLSCQDHTSDLVVPEHFELGSIGGFFSMSEVLDNLDLMAIEYPNLVSTRRAINNIKTYKNNNIFVVKISDNVDTEENEPEVLYTGLHHAREPISVSELIFYMWYLLENYDKNPMIKEIIDHTELFFVPVVNPDGLEYNLQGYDPVNDVFTRDHRKNMRDNNNNGIFDPETDGVDLNRNYGHEWAFDDEGSSGAMGSINYRGPAPFSEPETKAIQFLCNQHQFKIALNAHSFANALIYPWGFNSSTTLDSAIFANYAELMCRQNGFVFGLGEDLLGYKTNGDSDDWMYGAKDIYAMTPEIGDENQGFYPLSDDIIPLCQSVVQMNLLASRLVNSLIQITDETPDFIHLGDNPLDLEFNRYGLLNDDVLITFHSLSPHILQVPEPILMDMKKFEPNERHLSFKVDNLIPYGSTVKIEIVCQQGTYTFRDTLTKTRADFNILIEDTGSDLSKWDDTNGKAWGTTNASYKSGPVSITDSPNTNYGVNADESLVLRSQVDLTQATTAYAQFWAKWDMEDFYDYVVFQVSKDGENWENLCGEQSNLGSIFQLYEEPLYDGFQEGWVLETTDLSSYVGKLVQVRFLLRSDGFESKDGFYFDDFKIITVNQKGVATEDVHNNNIHVYPNPAQQTFTIAIPELQHASLEVFNSLGQSVLHIPMNSGQSKTVDAATWPSGLYHYIILENGKSVHHGSVNLSK